MKLSNESVVVELKNSTVVQAKQPSCHPIFHILSPFSEMRVLGVKKKIKTSLAPVDFSSKNDQPGDSK